MAMRNTTYKVSKDVRDRKESTAIVEIRLLSRRLSQGI
jgi:hypothetical protein